MVIKRILNSAYDLLTPPLNHPAGYGLLFSDTYETALQEHRALKKQSPIK